MEVKLPAGLIQILIAMIAATGASISFLYTMSHIKGQIWISEYAQIQKAKDADCLQMNIKQDTDVLS
jgi:hypothetical protein